MKRPSELIIKPVESEEELREVNRLLAEVHVGDVAAKRRWLEGGGQQYPGYRREHTRMVLWRGDLAGGLRMNTETVRIGEARLKMAGLGWVTTNERHRRHGICSSLLDDTLRYLRERGYHISMLFGIPEFYHRFGYVTALADYEVVVESSEAAKFENPFRMRAAKPGDIPALQRIHAAGEAGIACSLVRSGAHVQNKWDLWPYWQVLIDAQGKIVAYFHAAPAGGELDIAEVGIEEAGVAPAILSAAGAMAHEEALATIRFHVPPPHPFARFMLEFKSRHEMRIQRDSGGMLAFVRIEDTLESLIPEWESLLARSAAHDFRTEFTLVVAGSCHRVRATRGAIDISTQPGKNKLSLDPGELMHLMTGYRHADDILNARLRAITAEARMLLNTLFPKRTPFVWPFDRF